VLDHYANPRNVGSLDKEAKNVGTGIVGAPACGDVMKLQVRVDEDGIITDAKFKTFGCGSAIASSSVATEWLLEKHVDGVLIKNNDIAQYLKLPPVKLHCSMLAEDAIKAAIDDWKEKNSDKRIIALGKVFHGTEVEDDDISTIDYAIDAALYQMEDQPHYLNPEFGEAIETIENFIKNFPGKFLKYDERTAEMSKKWDECNDID